MRMKGGGGEGEGREGEGEEYRRLFTHVVRAIA